MHVMNTDATSYQSKNPDKCLETAEKGKKKKYLDACLQQHRNFTPFVISADGPSQGQGGGNTEKYCQPPCKKVEGNLRIDLRLREE